MADVKVVLKGSFSLRDVSVDDRAVPLVGTGASQSATVSFAGPGVLRRARTCAMSWLQRAAACRYA